MIGGGESHSHDRLQFKPGCKCQLVWQGWPKGVQPATLLPPVVEGKNHPRHPHCSMRQQRHWEDQGCEASRGD